MSTQPPSLEAPPFIEFAQQLRPQSVLRAAITAAYRRPEPECVAMLLESARLPAEQAQAAHALATDLARKLRDRKTGVGREGLVQGLIQEFSLSSQEGVALMCLAEALLRTLGRLVPQPRLLSLPRLHCDPVESGRRSIAQLASMARMLSGSSLSAAFDCLVSGRGIAAADLAAFRQLMAADYLAELRGRLALHALTHTSIGGRGTE